jgi:chromosome segregation ATPase
MPLLSRYHRYILELLGSIDDAGRLETRLNDEIEVQGSALADLQQDLVDTARREAAVTQELESLSTEHAVLQAALITAEHFATAGQEAVVALEAEVGELIQKYATVEAACSTARNDAQDRGAQVETLQSRVQELTAELNDALEEKSGLGRALSRKEADMADESSKLHLELSMAEAVLRDASSKCKTADAKVVRAEALRATAVAQVIVLEETLAQCQDEIIRCREELQDNDASHRSAAQVARERISVLEAESNRTANDVKRLKDDSTDALTAVHDRDTDIESLSARVQQLEASEAGCLDQLAAQLDTSRLDKTKLFEAEAALDQLRQTLATEEQGRHPLQAKLHDLERKLHDITAASAGRDDDLEQQTRIAEQQATIASARRAELEVEVAAAVRTLAERDDEIKVLLQRLGDFGTKLLGKEAALESAKAEVVQTAQEVEAVRLAEVARREELTRKLAGSARRFQAQNDEHRAALRAKTVELTNLRSAMEQASQKQGAHRAQLEQKDEKQQAIIDDQQINISLLTNESNTLSMMVKDLESNYSHLDEQLKVATSENAAAHTAAAHTYGIREAELTAEITRLKEAMTATRFETAENSVDIGNKLAKSDKLLERAQAEIGGLKRNLDDAREQQTGAEAQAARFSDEVHSLRGQTTKFRTQLDAATLEVHALTHSLAECRADRRSAAEGYDEQLESVRIEMRAAVAQCEALRTRSIAISARVEAIAPAELDSILDMGDDHATAPRRHNVLGPMESPVSSSAISPLSNVRHKAFMDQLRSLDNETSEILHSVDDSFARAHSFDVTLDDSARQHTFTSYRLSSTPAPVEKTELRRLPIN